MEIDKQVADRVLKARSELIMARRFYGTLVSNVDPIISRSHGPTAATDGSKHYFHPDYVITLTQAELLGVQAHESEHDARHHGSRRGNRDPVEWNRSCDFAINIDLVDQGFTLPEGALIDERFRGMSAEDIYRVRELDRQREKEAREKAEQEQESQPKDDESESDDGESKSEPEGDETDQGEKPETGDADEGEDEGDGQPGDDGEDTATEGQGEGQPGDQESDSSQPRQGEAGEAGQGKAALGDASRGIASHGKTESDEGGPAEDKSAGSVPSPKHETFDGDIGGVLDSAPTDGELAESDDKWERIVRQAASLAKKAGDLPGFWAAEIERRNQPTQNWHEVLRAWIDQGSRRLETWNRRNRRFSSVILPSTQPDGINTVAVVVDTSGSVDNEALAQVGAELQAALDERVIDRLVVVYNDTRVTAIQEYAPGDEFTLDAKGRGGTYLRPAFEWIAENIDDVRLIICFTDMELSDNDLAPEEYRPDAPVLFAVHGYPDRVRHYLANLPWDSPGIDVGDHWQ